MRIGCMFYCGFIKKDLSNNICANAKSVNQKENSPKNVPISRLVKNRNFLESLNLTFSPTGNNRVEFEIKIAKIYHFLLPQGKRTHDR